MTSSLQNWQLNFAMNYKTMVDLIHIIMEEEVK